METRRKRRRRWRIPPVVPFTAVLVLCAILFAPSPVHDSVTVEVGTQTVTAEQFSKKGDSVTLATDLSAIDLNQPGEYTLEFLYKKKTYTSTLQVVDTTPPAGDAVDQTIYIGQTLRPEDFVTNIQDRTAVSIAFSETPDVSKAGQQTVTLRLTDTSGNTGAVSAVLTVLADTTAPQFAPMSDLKVNIGQAVSYRSGVTVTDDRDGELNFTVDSSAVNLSQAGTYIIKYEASDSSGNTAVAQRKIQVSATLIVNRELVDKMAQQTLAKIVTEDMTAHQKLEKIFQYVCKNMTYASSSDKEIPQAAYRAMTKRQGDCYNYFALTKVLLDACGIENMQIERLSKTSSHYWLLVNIGTGWYHFDTTPHLSQFPFTCFMKTDAEVQAYSKSRTDSKTDYYNFDQSLYPARATQTYQAN